MSVSKQSYSGGCEHDAVCLASCLDILVAGGSAWMCDVSDSVPGGVVDVVPEGDVAVRRERDAVERAEPLRPLHRTERRRVSRQRRSEALPLAGAEIAFDVADLPVDPILSSDVVTERQ